MNILFKLCNLVALSRPVTCDNSRIRFNLLRYLLKTAFYKVLHRDLHVPSYEDGDEPAYKGMYYERLYDIQHGNRSFFGQLWFALNAIIHAYQMNHMYPRKPTKVS